jgi:hypothetical protein
MRRVATEYIAVAVAYLGGAVVRPPPPPLAWSMLEAVRGRPPPLAVIRGAVGGVWLVFEEVYGVKSKKGEKLLKKRSSKCFRTRILEVGLRPKKKVAKYSGRPPPFQISKYATEQWGRCVRIATCRDFPFSTAGV